MIHRIIFGKCRYTSRPLSSFLRSQSSGLRPLALILCLLSFVLYPLTSSAFTLGETYDRNNTQALEGVAITPLLNWVKKGDFILNTGKLNFDFRLEQQYLDASRKNADKFGIDDKGYIVFKGSRQVVPYIYGLPFPNVTADTPKAGNRIMENMKYTTYRPGALLSTAEVIWIGRGGVERQVVAAGKSLYYQTRPQGELPNPENFLYQSLTFVTQPMDLRGTVSMSWAYNEDKLETNFSYIPMLRRVRRTSPASRSDPFLGSDFCTDDNYLWNGKNQTMAWKLLGEKTILAPFTSPEKYDMRDLPEGGIKRKFIPFKIGYQVPGWQGAPWAPVDIVWSLRDVYVIEAIPKDPYYNYGRMVYYVDKETFYTFFKEVYDRSGTYWKTLFMHTSHQVSPKGIVLYPSSDGYAAIDDMTDHATYARMTYTPSLNTDTLYVPLSLLSPKDFSLSALNQLSK